MKFRTKIVRHCEQMSAIYGPVKWYKVVSHSVVFLFVKTIFQKWNRECWSWPQWRRESVSFLFGDGWPTCSSFSLHSGTLYGVFGGAIDLLCFWDRNELNTKKKRDLDKCLGEYYGLPWRLEWVVYRWQNGSQVRKHLESSEWKCCEQEVGHPWAAAAAAAEKESFLLD